MKKTKIIIPTLGLLLLSTAASVSGTVAWFAMNASVTATGMQISAKSNSVFLLIGSGDNDTVSEIQTANQTSTALTVAEGNSHMYPSAHETITNTTDATATGVIQAYQLKAEPHTRITKSAFEELDAEGQDLYEAVTGTNWYYQVADSATSYA